MPLSPKSNKPEETLETDKKIKTYFSSLKNVIKREPILHNKSPLRESSIERRSPQRFVGRLNLQKALNQHEIETKLSTELPVELPITSHEASKENTELSTNFNKQYEVSVLQNSITSSQGSRSTRRPNKQQFSVYSAGGQRPVHYNYDLNQSMQTPLLDHSIFTGGNSVMGRRMNKLRHQSPTSSKDIVAKFFGKNGMSKNSFRWNKPINASMDHKAI